MRRPRGAAVIGFVVILAFSCPDLLFWNGLSGADADSNARMADDEPAAVLAHWLVPLVLRGEYPTAARTPIAASTTIVRSATNLAMSH